MKTIENGNAVQLHYKGTLLNGEVFDANILDKLPNILFNQDL